jgi:hypothetical protein
MEIKFNLNFIYFLLAVEFCVVFFALALFFFIRSRKYKKLYLQQGGQPGTSSGALAGRAKKGTPDSPPSKSESVKSLPPKEKAQEGENKGKGPQEKEKGK